MQSQSIRTFQHDESALRPRRTSLWKEAEKNAGFIGLIALTNPIIITIYVLLAELETTRIKFWSVAMVLTFLVCGLSLGVLALMIRRERKAFSRKVGKTVMFEEAKPYDPDVAKLLRAVKAG
jgi:hypothetical protein